MFNELNKNVNHSRTCDIFTVHFKKRTLNYFYLLLNSGYDNESVASNTCCIIYRRDAAW